MARNRGHWQADRGIASRGSGGLSESKRLKPDKAGMARLKGAREGDGMAKKRGSGRDGYGTIRKGLKSDVTAGGERLKKKCFIGYLERWNVYWNVV